MMIKNDYLKSLNVLYVEDEPTTAKKFSSILRKIFNEVFYAPNGLEALDIFENNNINLIISDINMPILDGLELSKRVRQIDQNIPIILISARNESDTLLEAIDLNIDSYILKPISLDNFIEKIDGVSKKIEAKENQKILDQYKQVIDDASIVIKFDIDGKITYINKQYSEITGYKLEEIRGNYFNFNQHIDEKSSIYLELWEKIRDKEEWKGRLRNYTKDKNEYIIDSTIIPILDINKNLKEYICISNDVTDQISLNNLLNVEIKNYQNNLTNKSHLLSEYQRGFNEITSIAKLDNQFNIITVNSRFLRILDLSRKELINKNFFSFVNSQENNCIKLLDDLEDKKASKQIIIFDTKKEKKHIDFNFSPVLDSNKNIIEYLVVANDLTQTINLQNEIELTQKDVILTLGEIGEHRSNETGNHVRRVSKYSYLLAKKFGLSEEESKLIKLAAPMHDIGKIGIPDSILHKNGKLSREEFAIMKTHTTIGFDMLKNSQRKIMKAASIIAHEHHEKWDGSGYPRGLKGEEIHIYGRILSVVDTFDALGSERCYKKAWELDEILDYLKEKSGTDFDPKLVDLLLDNIEEFLKIKEELEEKVQGDVA
jgi:PAS domain S-box-containing protein